MSLIDKASLIQIPSGYKSTKLYSIEPTNGTGDFTFARSSSATRVNSEGLIETAQILGSEEVVNGDFATDSDWSKGIGWTINGGFAVGNLITNNYAGLQQSPTLSVGATYRYQFTISSYTSGIVRFAIGETVDEFYFSGNGVYSGNIKYSAPHSSGSTISIFAWGNFVGSIDNVSVKEVFENDVPRLDYSDGSCASLLLEPQRTNELIYSNSFDNVAWGKNSGGINTSIGTNGIEPNVAISPDGTSNASRVNFITQSDLDLGLGQTISSSSGNTHLFSVYVKGEGSNIGKQINIRVKRSSGGAYIGFDNSITLTSEWQRVKLNPLTLITDNNGARIIVSSNDATNCLIAFSQGEQGDYPTSYIPTTSASTTRSADVCNNAGTSATFNDSEGVLFAEIAANALTSTLEMLSLSDGTYNNVVLFRYYDTSSNDIQVQVKVAGSAQASMLFTLTDATSFNKIALKYKANDFALWVNGIEVATDTSGNTFSANTLNRLSFDRGDGGNDFYGKTKQLMVFDEALSDEELSDLTGQANLSFNNLATFYGYTIL